VIEGLAAIAGQALLPARLVLSGYAAGAGPLMWGFVAGCEAPPRAARFGATYMR
jgi:hypothetical protein